MMLPFKMRTETPMEKYRAETFWEKEPETIAWIESFDPHDIFFDVGANVGVYSLYAASLFPKMTIHAFEPMWMNYEVLKMNIKANGFNILPWSVAVGNYDGQDLLDIPDAEAGKSGAQISNNGVYAVKVIKIDTLLVYPHHVKIDIDGRELQVILGMRRALSRAKSILVEVGRQSRQPIMDIMTGAGFTTDNRFNTMSPHSRERREREGIDAENIVFTR